jgi:hypothetical protein
MAVSGDREAMDKQPGQRQRDGQPQPDPQPGREKNPHAQHPFFFLPAWTPAQGHTVADVRDFLRIELCIAALPTARLAHGWAGPVVFAALPAARRANHPPARLVLARCGG